jgi:hypothetical protein
LEVERIKLTKKKLRHARVLGVSRNQIKRRALVGAVCIYDQNQRHQGTIKTESMP